MELKAQRNSNIELLRIIAMLMIVAHHYALYGLSAEYLVDGPNRWLTSLLFSYGKTGVNIFILITGYYMVNMNFSIKRPLKIMGQVWFYSLLMLLVCLRIPAVSEQIGRNQMLAALFPISSNEYWFATQYVLLLAVSPFLNRFAHSVGEKQLTLCVIVLVIFNSVIPCMFAALSGNMDTVPFYSQPVWFAALYLMAARVRLYSPDSAERGGRRRHALCAIVWGISIPAWAWGRQILFAVTERERFHGFLSLSQMDWSIFGIMFALELFQCVRLMKPQCRRWINLLASFSFGVYLLHSHPLFFAVKAAVFGKPEPVSAAALILQASAVVFGCYFTGSVIDLVRQKTVGRLWDRAVDKLSPGLERWGCLTLQKTTAWIDRSNL